MKTILASAILMVFAMTNANSEGKKPKEDNTQIRLGCGKLPYASFAECLDHNLKIGYGIQVTSDFCHYHCSR